MATSYTCADFDAFVLSKREAVHVIALLAAQLGDTCVDRHHVGAAPDFTARDERGGNGRRIVLSVKPDGPVAPENPS